jgi:hypothetical protein
MGDEELTDRLLKQQALIWELDGHYQTVTGQLEAQVVELENLVKGLRQRDGKVARSPRYGAFRTASPDVDAREWTPRSVSHRRSEE